MCAWMVERQAGTPGNSTNRPPALASFRCSNHSLESGTLLLAASWFQRTGALFLYTKISIISPSILCSLTDASAR